MYLCGNGLGNSLPILAQSALESEFPHELLSEASGVLLVRHWVKANPLPCPHIGRQRRLLLLFRLLLLLEQGHLAHPGSVYVLV